MGSFGEKLKREREMRAITLEEIADATKIGTRSLRALEEEHFDQLPGGIFNKGFVRAYARFLGIDEEQAVADYMTATNEVGNSTATQLAALADQVEQHRAAKEAENGSSGNTGTMLAIILLIVVVCGVGFGGYKAWQYKKQQRTSEALAAHIKQPLPSVPVAQQPAPITSPAASNPTDTNPAATSQNATSVTTPANNSTTPAATPQSSTSATTSPEFPITVTLKAVKSSWVMVNSDGKTVYQQTMGPDDQQITLHGKDKILLVLGNAGGVEVSFNGKTLGSLGSDGQTRRLTITPQGMQP